MISKDRYERFIHLFIRAISIAPPQVHYYPEALPTNTDTVSEFHAEARTGWASHARLKQAKIVRIG